VVNPNISIHSSKSLLKLSFICGDVFKSRLITFRIISLFLEERLVKSCSAVYNKYACFSRTALSVDKFLSALNLLS
jgi:hypothetical protein